MSANDRWASYANDVMRQLAYGDKRRGFKPLGRELLQRMLAAKKSLVDDAEHVERIGGIVNPQQFQEKIYATLEYELGYRDSPDAGPADDGPQCTCDGLGECEACKASARAMLKHRGIAAPNQAAAEDDLVAFLDGEP